MADAVPPDVPTVEEPNDAAPTADLAEMAARAMSGPPTDLTAQSLPDSVLFDGAREFSIFIDVVILPSASRIVAIDKPMLPAFLEAVPEALCLSFETRWVQPSFEQMTDIVSLSTVAKGLIGGRVDRQVLGRALTDTCLVYTSQNWPDGQKRNLTRVGGRLDEASVTYLRRIPPPLLVMSASKFAKDVLFIEDIERA